MSALSSKISDDILSKRMDIMLTGACFEEHDEYVRRSGLGPTRVAQHTARAIHHATSFSFVCATSSRLGRLRSVLAIHKVRACVRLSWPT